MHSKYKQCVVFMAFFAIACGGDTLVPANYDAGIPPQGCMTGTVQSCYDGPSSTQDIGICHAGTSTCNDNGSWGPCINQQTPETETCNCLDNDCNGVVGDIPIGPCYTGPSGTVGVGTCDYGVNECDNRSCTQVCANEVTPEPNQCDGVDRECNGMPLTTSASIDLVFIVDDTDNNCQNAMGLTQFSQIQETLTEYAQAYTQSNFNYSLIIMPGCTGNWPSSTTDAGYEVYQENTSSQTFVQGYQIPDGGNIVTGIAFQCLVDPTNTPSCSNDKSFYSFDILYKQASGSIVPWTPGAKRYLIMFTASPPESSSVMYNDQAINQQLSSNPSVTTVIFTQLGFLTSYLPPLSGTPGKVFQLSDTQTMLNDLESVLQFPCN